MKNRSLAELVMEINKKFKVNKKQKYSIIMWSLVCWQNGYWSVEITDDWHKWLDKQINMPCSQYITPEIACEEFLKFIENNKINISELQSK